MSDLQTELANYRDALDHIMRVARASRMGSRRDRWIAERARCALEGTDEWRVLDYPKTVDTDSKRLARLRASLRDGESEDQHL